MCKYCLQWNHGEYKHFSYKLDVELFLWFELNVTEEGREYLHHKRVPLNSWHDNLKAEILVKLFETPTHFNLKLKISFLLEWTIQNYSLQSITDSKKACQISYQPISSNPSQMIPPSFVFRLLSCFSRTSLGVFATQIWYHWEIILNWFPSKNLNIPTKYSFIHELKTPLNIEHICYFETFDFLFSQFGFKDKSSKSKSACFEVSRQTIGLVWIIYYSLAQQMAQHKILPKVFFKFFICSVGLRW